MEIVEKESLLLHKHISQFKLESKNSIKNLKIFTFKLQNCKKLKFKIAKFINKKNKKGKNKK